MPNPWVRFGSRVRNTFSAMGSGAWHGIKVGAKVGGKVALFGGLIAAGITVFGILSSQKKSDDEPIAHSHHHAYDLSTSPPNRSMNGPSFQTPIPGQNMSYSYNSGNAATYPSPEYGSSAGIPPGSSNMAGSSYVSGTYSPNMHPMNGPNM